MIDRNCPKHVEFYSKNKFEKLVHLVGFIIRIGLCLKYGSGDFVTNASPVCGSINK